MKLLFEIPFKIVKHIKYQFILFTLFTILLGNLGVLLPTIVFFFDLNQAAFSKSIIKDGALLLTVIPLASSSIYILLNNISYSDQRRFRAVKLVCIGVLLLYIIISVISYSKSMLLETIENHHVFINVTLYFLGLIMIYYAFILQYMDHHYESFQEYDDKQVTEIVEKAATTHNVGEIEV